MSVGLTQQSLPRLGNSSMINAGYVTWLALFVISLKITSSTAGHTTLIMRFQNIRMSRKYVPAISCLMLLILLLLKLLIKLLLVLLVV